MKLVIEVNKEDYKRYVEDKVCSYASAVLYAVPFNEVLDEIRAEITNDIHKCNNTDMAFGMQHTLDIVDKYKAESEVHE